MVVADNGSTDGTADLVHARSLAFPNLRLVDASAERGAAFARNEGVRQTTGTSVVFCDADDVVGGGWLAAMAAGLRAHKFVTGPQEYERLNEAWLHGAWGTATATGLQHFAGVFPFGPTANLGIHRRTFDTIGAFDEALSPHEDLEFCLRAWLAGVPLTFVPEAVVHYRYRSSMRSLWRQASAYARAAPDIARRLAAAGRPTPPRWRGLRNWLWLVRRLPTLRSRRGRARWVVVAGGCAGRLRGSLRYRYLLL